MTKKIIIKRYGNRRLYNSETRSYVKLLDIAQFIREGAEIQVLDSRTGEDITKLVLTQIILEEEKSKKDLLPINFLYDLIRHQQGWVQEFFQRHVVKALEGVLPVRSEILTNLRQSLDFRNASGSFWERFRIRGESANRAAVHEVAAGAASSAAEGTASIPASAEAGAAAASPLATPAASSDDEPGFDERADLFGAVAFEELMQRLEAIESRMSRLEGKPPARHALGEANGGTSS